MPPAPARPTERASRSGTARDPRTSNGPFPADPSDPADPSNPPDPPDRPYATNPVHVPWRTPAMPIGSRTRRTLTAAALPLASTGVMFEGSSASHAAANPGPG